MKKLIKLSETHYIIVDDSEIKEGDCRFHLLEKTINLPQHRLEHGEKWATNSWRKITYSTSPLEHTNEDHLFFDKIQQLSLQECEEAIQGYSIVKLAEKYADETFYGVDEEQDKQDCRIDYIAGFIAHQQLAKDRLFTRQDVIDIVEKSRETGLTAEYFITKYLLPKTEWEIEIDENNKMKLV